LLTKRAIEPAKGYWHLPGGTLLKGESVAEAGVRIAAEELGSEIDMQDLLGFIEYTPEMSAGQGVSLVFQASLKSSKITLNEQASEFAYFNPLPEDTISETKKFLEQKVLK
jgi:colanic acid biosynthesis protein WcaH